MELSREPEGVRQAGCPGRDWFSVDGTVTVDAAQVLTMRDGLDRLQHAKGRCIRWRMIISSRWSAR